MFRNENADMKQHRQCFSLPGCNLRTTGDHKIVLYGLQFRHNAHCRIVSWILRRSHLLLALTQNLDCQKFKNVRKMETFAIPQLVTR